MYTRENTGINLSPDDSGLDLTDNKIQSNNRFYRSLLKTAIGFFSVLAIYASLSSIQNNSSTYYKKKSVTLEELLPNHKIIGRLEIKLKDLKKLSKNGYLVRNKTGDVFYEFDEQNQCIHAYPLVRKQTDKKPEQRNINSPLDLSHFD